MRDRDKDVTLAALLAMLEAVGGRVEISVADLSRQIGCGLGIEHKPGMDTPWILERVPKEAVDIEPLPPATTVIQ